MHTNPQEIWRDMDKNRNFFGMPSVKWLEQATLREILLDGFKVGAVIGVPFGALLILFALVGGK